MKLVLKSIDEVAKWRKTSFKTKLTDAEIVGYEQKFGIGNLYVHFDSGVPRSTRGVEAGAKLWEGGEEDYDYSIDPDTDDPNLEDPRSTERVPQKSFNPQTRFKTPVGIYLYQLKYAREILGIKDFGDPKEVNKFPFAAEHKFIYIYYIRPKDILKIGDVNKGDLFERTIKKTIEMSGDTGPLGPFSPGKKVYEALKKAGLYTNVFELNRDPGKLEQLVNNGQLWEYFKKHFTGVTTRGPAAEFGRVWFYFTNNFMDNNINKWSKFLVDLGVRAISDYGNGIIHPSEPHQAVIIDTGAAKLVMAKDNPNDRTNIKSDDQKDTENDAIVDKYSQYAQFTSNPNIIRKILRFKLAELDQHLALNKNISSKTVEILLNRTYSSSYLLKNLMANPSVGIDEVKKKLIKMINTLGTQKHAMTLKKGNPSELLFNSMHTSLQHDSEYKQKIIDYFADDAGVITNLLPNIKPTPDELKKIIAGMRGSRTTTQPLSQKYALLVNCLWSGKVDPTGEWIRWVWSLNDPDLPRTGVIRHMLQFYYLKPSLGTPDDETMKAFAETVYKDMPSSDEELNQEWNMFLKKFGQAEKMIAESKKHKIYFKLPRR